MLMKAFQSGSLQPGKLVTHRFALDEILKAYDTFGNAARHSALKVALKAGNYARLCLDIPAEYGSRGVGSRDATGVCDFVRASSARLDRLKPGGSLPHQRSSGCSPMQTESLPHSTNALSECPCGYRIPARRIVTGLASVIPR
jgi:hypothetical protein